MDLETLLSYEWGIMAPEFIILGVATLLSLIDLFMGKNQSRKILAWIGIAGIIAAIGFVIAQLDTPVTQILADTYRLDSFSKVFKLILLAGAGLVLVMSLNYDPEDSREFRGEYIYLILTGLLGAMMMASSADLITLFVGLELLSISSYILAGIRRKRHHSNEAAMKYVINGGISTAIFMFGISYVFGLTGTTNLYVIGQTLQSLADADQLYLMGIAFFMVFVGLSFKIASAPFHMWAPDVYQGSPTPITAFLSVVSKTAGFVILMRIVILVFLFTPATTMNSSLLLSVQAYIAVLAAITMIVGNTVALRQKNVKRLFAYSSIAHAGYLLVAFTAFSPALLFSNMWFYLVAYLLMNLGAFAIIQTVTERSGTEDISGFAGLYRRSPVTAILMGILLLSLAGIPGTAGFMAKFNIFLGALSSQPAQYVLAGIMIATTVVSYFYYFGLMAQMFMRPARDYSKVKMPAGVLAVVVVTVAGTLLFGVLPGVALDFFHNNFNFLEFFGQA
ncbi:NADH-quinone oxidoreductase subunit NuoN [Bacillus marinisedimentorum]|uniref:NADH-quinone oxidoreductase subunit NuoN n=1 Tax=Bacillus marinisedimentorum TaxID=1821260 RepID=UPI0007DEDA14|nr:NADH-quinone oxidoreductase subunit NuoN [Bacillus marinisedimentorum]